MQVTIAEPSGLPYFTRAKRVAARGTYMIARTGTCVHKVDHTHGLHYQPSSTSTYSSEEIRAGRGALRRIVTERRHAPLG